MWTSGGLCGNLAVMEELAALVEAEGLSRFAAKVGVSKSYLCHVLKKRKPFGPSLAIRVYKATGQKLGPLAEAA